MDRSRWGHAGPAPASKRRDFLHLHDLPDVAKAIREMVIRGAPAIGVAAAMGVAIGVQNSSAKSLEDLRAEFPLIIETLAKTRPTAVDLFWALARVHHPFAALSLTTPQSAQLQRQKMR